MPNLKIDRSHQGRIRAIRLVGRPARIITRDGRNAHKARRASDKTQLAKISDVWWLHPTFLYLYFIIPVYILIVIYLGTRPANSHQISPQIRVKDYLDLYGSAAGLSALIAFVIGTLIRPRPGQIVLSNEREVSGGSFRLLLALSLFGYATFFLSLALSTSILVLAKAMLGDTHSMYALRRSDGLLPGITTMTQFCPALAMATVIYWKKLGDGSIKWILWIGIGVLALVRAVAYAERAAILEIAFPTICVVLIRGNHVDLLPRRWFRILMRLGPWIGIVALIPFFAIFEAPRSWFAYREIYHGNILAFAVDRIAAYYCTALNNGSAYLAFTDTGWSFPSTFDWLYHLPFVGALGPFQAYSDFLSKKDEIMFTHLDKEFNNPSGIFMYILDYGPALCALVFLILGMAARYTYEFARAGNAGAQMMYGIFFYGSYEILRIPYLGLGRTTYIYVGIAICYFCRPAQARRLRPNVPLAAAAK